MSWSELRKGRVSQFGREYFITFVTNNRTDIFHDFDAAKLFCQQIAANQQIHNCRWLTWVLMPDHFHGLLRLESESTSLSAIVGHLKGR
ncbi:transposase, partial [Oceanospirillum sp. HFRX-1_2]